MSQNSTIITRGATQKAKIQTRAMYKSSTSKTSVNSLSEQRKPNTALLEAKRKAKLQKMQQQTQHELAMKDVFQNSAMAKTMIRGDTGLIYDENMSKHRCLWDDEHPERPERLIRVLERCRELNLVERCKRIPSRRASKAEVLLLHTAEHYELLQQTSEVDNEEKLEDLSSRFDSVYIHPSTFELSLLAVGSTIDLIEHVTNGSIHNGMAIIRPPGHHAMKSEFNGYCFFNNVAIAARYALEILKLQRIMIIDWDIHHGQGTQRFFYNDARVLYFSIHRFEHGKFWPNLKETDFDAIGEGAGLGYNFNVPLNEIGMGNAEYLAIFQQLLVPVAVEYQPELIIISAGYDAAVGCPEGEMEVTPACYAHLLHAVSNLAQSRLAVVLEGGYCLESLAEGAALTLRSLLGDNCPRLVEKLQPIKPLAQEAILNCIYAHRPYWRCLQTQGSYGMLEFNNINPQADLHKVSRLFIGGEALPERFPTRGTAPVQLPGVAERNQLRLQNLKAETQLHSTSMRVCFVYDELMLQHSNEFEDGHPEQPARIRKMYEMHEDYALLQRMHHLSSRVATTDEICLAHTRTHLNFIRRIGDKQELSEISAKYNSVYFHPKTFESATMAAGSVLQVVDKVLQGEARSGVCLVRPPGHHAESEEPHGFCIFNNVAIAAKYALRDYALKRILILDWDVHHGNGTQHMFEDNPQVLYISIHRYDNATFFPKSTDANFDVVGKGAGIGFNVNIPWNKKQMGDMEYIMAFQQLILPIAYEFDPELVLVSAGFDAAVGDPLGGCKVTPEAYGIFTHWMSALAGGRIIICLEGGYNVNSIAFAMTMCTKALLGDPMPSLQVNASITRPATSAYLSCVETIQNCRKVQMRHWKCLTFGKRLPDFSGGTVNNENNNEDFLTASLKQLNITTDSAATGAIAAKETHCAEHDTELASGSKPKVKVKTLTEFLTENLQALQNEEMFAVMPLKTCPHLNELRNKDAPESIDTNAPCCECQSTAENWMCLLCGKVLCGRYINEHMLLHSVELEHALAISFSDLSVWCYPCEAYIDNRILYAYKNAAHRHKFGENMPWTYASKQPTAANNFNVNNQHNDDDYDDDDDDDDDENEQQQQQSFCLELVNNDDN